MVSLASAISLRAAVPIDFSVRPPSPMTIFLWLSRVTIDRLLDARRAVGQILPGFGLDRRLIGQFVVQPLEHLLARDLGGERAHRRVGDLVLGIEPRPLRHHRARDRASAGRARRRSRREIMNVSSNGSAALSRAASASSSARSTRSILLRISTFAPLALAQARRECAATVAREVSARRSARASTISAPRRRRPPRRPRRRRPSRGRAGAWARTGRACRRTRSAPRPR